MRMSKLQRRINIVAVILPFLAFIAAIVLLWNSAIGWSDLVVMVVMYVVSAFGITIGYHRLLTHRAFQTHKPVEYALAAAGSMAVQGPVIDWVADHRKHHAHTDEEGDPHSPARRPRQRPARASGTPTSAGCSRPTARPSRRKYAPDLMDDRGMRLLNRRFLPLVGLSLGHPVRARLAADRQHRRRPHRPALGRPRADLLRPPRHLVDQLDLPLLRLAAASPPTTSRPTSGGSRSSRSARPGTTTTTPSPARPSTACAAGSSTPRAPSSALMQRLGLAWNVVAISPERQEQRLA